MSCKESQRPNQKIRISQQPFPKTVSFLFCAEQASYAFSPELIVQQQMFLFLQLQRFPCSYQELHQIDAREPFIKEDHTLLDSFLSLNKYVLLKWRAPLQISLFAEAGLC